MADEDLWSLARVMLTDPLHTFRRVSRMKVPAEEPKCVGRPSVETSKPARIWTVPFRPKFPFPSSEAVTPRDCSRHCGIPSTASIQRFKSKLLEAPRSRTIPYSRLLPWENLANYREFPAHTESLARSRSPWCINMPKPVTSWVSFP